MESEFYLDEVRVDVVNYQERPPKADSPELGLVLLACVVEGEAALARLREVLERPEGFAFLAPGEPPRRMTVRSQSLSSEGRGPSSQHQLELLLAPQPGDIDT